ncbi:MAG TPA: AraC family transcriptional regulator [Chitinophaga sp.]
MKANHTDNIIRHISQLQRSPSPHPGEVLKLQDKPVIAIFSGDSMAAGSIFTEEHLLVFVTKGSGAIRFGDTYHTASKDQLLLLRKNILVHYHSFDAAHPMEWLVFYMRDEIVTEFIRITKTTPYTIADLAPITLNSVTEKLHTYLDSVIIHFREQSRLAAQLIRIKLFELLFHLPDEARQALFSLVKNKQPERPDITTTVEGNIMNNISVRELAALSGRSLSSFKRDFQAIYNMPPSQWIRQRRLEKARELVTRTSMSVTDICYTLGFEHIAHFSRLFKAHFGMAPTQYKVQEQPAFMSAVA